MPPPTLLRLAQRACIANIRHIDGFGDLPYDVLRPILLKVDSAYQLRTIEENSPQICGLDGELWQSLIKRDIPNWEKKLKNPKNPNNWWKVYRKLRRELEEQMKGQEAALKAALNERKTEKENHRITIVNKVMVPRKRMSGPLVYSAKPSSGQGVRTNTQSGKTLMDRVRRQAREASLMSAGRGALATPTHLLATKAMKRPPFQMSSALKASLRPTSPTVQEPKSINEANVAAASIQKRIIGTKRLPPSVFVLPRKRRKV